MTASALTTNTESDPVAVALADPVIGGRLLAAARAFLIPRTHALTAPRREAEAEEIVSTARVRAWEKRGQFDPGREVVSWLVGFVINVAREYLKKAGRESTVTPGAAPELETLTVDIGMPIDTLVAQEQADRVSQLLARVSGQDRELLRLKYEEDLTFSEIGAMLGIDANTARVRHHRLIGRLRQLCGETGEGQP